MSLYRVTFIECNDCHATEDKVGGDTRTQMLLDEHAVQQGWHIGKGPTRSRVDRCASCQEKWAKGGAHQDPRHPIHERQRERNAGGR